MKESKEEEEDDVDDNGNKENDNDTHDNEENGRDDRNRMTSSNTSTKRAFKNSDINDASLTLDKRKDNSCQRISETEPSDLTENSMRLMVLDKVEQASSDRLKRKRRRKVRYIAVKKKSCIECDELYLSY